MNKLLSQIAVHIVVVGGVLALLPQAAQAARGTHETEDSNALIMTAEIALQRDDCGRAAANYTIAAQRLTDVKLAARATEVALDCGRRWVSTRSMTRAAPSKKGSRTAASRMPGLPATRIPARPEWPKPCGCWR